MDRPSGHGELPRRECAARRRASRQSERDSGLDHRRSNMGFHDHRHVPRRRRGDPREAGEGRLSAGADPRLGRAAGGRTMDPAVAKPDRLAVPDRLRCTPHPQRGESGAT